MNRAEHLAWAKQRALECVNRGELREAFTSLLSDLGKHPDLKQSQDLCGELGLMLFVNGHLNTPKQMTDWIVGFN